MPFITYSLLSDLYSILVITIVHAGHRHAVVVVKEAQAQVHEIKSNVHQLLLVMNNGCHIYETDSEQNTPSKIIMQNVLCNFYWACFKYFTQ